MSVNTKLTAEEIQNIDSSLFQPATEKNLEIESIQGSSLSFWKDAKIRFFKNKAAIVSVVLLATILFVSAISPFIGSYHNVEYERNGTTIVDPNYIGDYSNPTYKYLPPKVPGLAAIGIFDGTKNGVDMYEKAGVPEGTYFLMGTDNLGRDVFVRNGIGALISIAFGLSAAIVDILLGVTLGGISGYYGGKVDLILQRFVEIIGSVPTIIYVTIMVLLIGSGFLTLLIAIVISGWIPMYRIVRAQVLKLKEQEFVLSSITLGGSGMKILFKHIVPNAIGVIIIWLMFTIPSAIFFESFMSYLGLGISLPIPSLGSLASAGKSEIVNNTYLAVLPTLTLASIMLTFNLIADGLRDAFDPKMRGGE